MEEVKKQGMESLFVPYEIALDLKELGFDEPCFAWTIPDNKKFVVSLCEKYNGRENLMTQIPLYQQAFRWFREKYRLDGKPEYFLNNFYCFIINDMKQEDTSRRLFTEFPSYEEAELECLKKLIEIVKNNGK